MPKYQRPPIDEVAISVQFSAIEGCTNERLHEFWREVRDDYPFVEIQPPLDVPLESVDPPLPAPLQFQVATALPKNMRLWLISDSDDLLVQVQNSRFIQNWRRRGSEYPQFKEVRQLFWSNFARFKDFLKAFGLQHPTIQQVEITYINWISDQTNVQFLRPASAGAITVDGVVHQPSKQLWSAVYEVPANSAVIQRLYVQSAPAVRTQNPAQSGSQFSLTVRAANPEGVDDDSAALLIENARKVIVDAFTSLTTPEAQQLWERLR